MKKELFEKLNQLDRIEYKVRDNITLIGYAAILIITLICFGTAMILTFHDVLFAGVMMLCGFISLIAALCIDSVLTARLDNKFMQRLEIRGKK